MSGTAVVARVGLDDRGFQEGIQKIQRSLKVVQSEFAAASSKLGDFGKSTETSIRNNYFASKFSGKKSQNYIQSRRNFTKKNS